jgi:hypothetical protein
VQVAPDDARILGQARPAERVPVAGVPVLRRADRDEVAQEADAPVPAADQVADPRGRALVVVGHHAVGGQQGGRPVHEDQRRSELLVVAQVTVVAPGRDDDQAVHPPREQGGGQIPLALGILVETARQDADTARPGRVLHRPVDARGVRVGDILEHQADHEGLAVAAPQVAGRQVVPVIELRSRAAVEDHHAGPHLRADQLAALAAGD